MEQTTTIFSEKDNALMVVDSEQPQRNPFILGNTVEVDLYTWTS